jgi:hypothetical protein
MQIGLVAGIGVVYLLEIIRICLKGNDLGGHIALMRRALLCCSVVILGAMVMMEARTSSLAEPDAVVGAVTMGWTRSVVGAWGGHLATALGLLSVVMVGLLLQGWVLLGQMRSFFATAAQDRKTRDQIELHATE